MATLAPHTLPVVRTFEVGDELVVEVELPPEEHCIRAELEGRLLMLRFARPDDRHPEWRMHPDAAPV